MSTAEEELQILYDNLYQIRVVNYMTIAGVAFLTYDILTNLDKEIPLIWRYYRDHDDYGGASWGLKARRALIQVLFIFARYYALLFLIGYFAVNNHVGFSVPDYFFYTIFAGEILYTTLVNVILIMRLNALYQIFNGTEGLRKYQIFLAACVITEFMAELIICATTAVWVQSRVVETPPGVPWPGCVLSENPNTALTLPSWTVAILITTTFFGSTLYLLFSSIRWKFKRFSDFTIANIKEEIRNIQPMTLLLIRDGLLFYFPIFGILVSAAVMEAVFRSTIEIITEPIIMSLYSFVASRFIINTRESISRAGIYSSTYNADRISFASRTLLGSRSSATHARSET